MNTLKIICPDSYLSFQERISQIIDSFGQWITSDSFIELLQLFGANYPDNATNIDKIKWLKNDFIDIWDYRKKQREALTKEGEAARWLLTNDSLLSENSTIIYNAATKLGLIGIDTSIFTAPDYILPLGGARMSNLRRCELAQKESLKFNNTATVVALSGMRPLSETEYKGYIDTYAPQALTEYDAICCGMKKAFDIICNYDEEKYENSNINLSYAIRSFTDTDNKPTNLYALAAPSTDPTRRSNSADCFKFFFEKFNIKEHSKIINCTSQIYCTYQQVRSLFFALDYNVEFDTIGFPYVLNNVSTTQNDQQLAEPVNYLQEIKATVDAMYDFIMKYCN